MQLHSIMRQPTRGALPLWGASPAVDLGRFANSPTNTTNTTSASSTFVLYGTAEPTHILATVHGACLRHARRLRAPPNSNSNPETTATTTAAATTATNATTTPTPTPTTPTPPTKPSAVPSLLFVLYESHPAMLARVLVLLRLVFASPPTLSDSVIATRYLQLHSSLSVSHATHRHLVDIISDCKRISLGETKYLADGRIVNPASATRTRWVTVEVGKLRIKDREDICSMLDSWQSPLIQHECLRRDREERVRRYLGMHYDSRFNLFDWDFHMRVAPKTPSICRVAYILWRETGITAVKRIDSSAPNPMMVTPGMTENEWGYNSDILSGPFAVFSGIEADAVAAKVAPRITRQHTHAHIDAEDEQQSLKNSVQLVALTALISVLRKAQYKVHVEINLCRSFQALVRTAGAAGAAGAQAAHANAPHAARGDERAETGQPSQSNTDLAPRCLVRQPAAALLGVVRWSETCQLMEMYPLSRIFVESPRRLAEATKERLQDFSARLESIVLADFPNTGFSERDHHNNLSELGKGDFFAIERAT